MTSQTVERYEGTWRRLANISAGRKGSIHDDDAARGMGFRGGFVPGSTGGQAAMPAIIARLGQQWMEGGWYSFKFVRPVYIDEEVREVGSELLADGTLPLQVEARDGRLCCDGAAGLGATLPWDGSEDGTHGADEVFPAMTIGDAFAPSELHVVADEVAAMIAAAGDPTPWYESESPWGGPIIPPERLMNAALNAIRGEIRTDESVRNPGMWAEHSIAMAQPVFAGRTYAINQHLADKGLSGRTAYVDYQFEVTDDSGALCATGRHKIKWILQSEQPGDRP